MKEFNQLCKEFEQMDPALFDELLTQKSAEILPALTLVAGGASDAVHLFSTFLIASVAADGKLSEGEYACVAPLFKVFFGEAPAYADCKREAKRLWGNAAELKSVVDALVDLIGTLSEELKDDIILVCLMICAIDGKVSLAEKRWIKQLIRE